MSQDAFRYRLSQLIETYSFAKANPDATIRVNPTGFYQDFTGSEWVAWFRRQLDKKITAKMSPVSGRKASDEYQVELGRMIRYVGNRIVIDWIAPILGPRVRAAFSHRMRSHD